MRIDEDIKEKEITMNRRYRKTVIAGNWKMNMTATETKKFAEELKKIMPRAKWCDTLICVPACNIQTAAKAFKDLRISVGAENVYFEEKGAYTGEISADMLKGPGREVRHRGPQRAAAVFLRDRYHRQQEGPRRAECRHEPHHLRGREPGAAGDRHHRRVDCPSGEERPVRRARRQAAPLHHRL